MKNLKKVFSIVIAVVLAFGMMTMAFAATDGKITVKGNTNVSLKNRTINLYKVLDAELVNGVDATGGIIYRVPGALKGFFADLFDIDEDAASFNQLVTNAIENMRDDDDALQAFAKAALDAANEAGLTPISLDTEDSEAVTFTNLTLGYYLVEDAGTSTPVSALALTTTEKESTIIIKADKPSIIKKIDANENEQYDDADVSYNETSIGKTVPFVAKTAVPDMTGYKKYYFVAKDTMSAGLTFNNDIAVYMDGEELSEDAYTVYVTNNDDDTTSFEIVFKNFIQYKADKGAEIEITYSAVLNEDAVIGVEGNPNEIDLTYSNNPNFVDEGTPDDEDKPGDTSPVGVTPKSYTRTYVDGIKVIKVDPDGNRLTGAKFTISGTGVKTVLVTTESFAVDQENGTYWKLTDGTYTTDDPATEGMDQDAYESTTVKYKKTTTTTTQQTTEQITTEATVGDDGTLTFEGLGAGTYTITETAAPEGYNILVEPVEVTLTWTAPASTATSEDCTWTVEGAAINADGIAEIEIVNQSGQELPSTGGIGTTIFYIIGAVLVAGAAILLITKKRMASAK